MGNKSSVDVFSFYKANKIELQLDAILEAAKESAVSPAGSSVLETGTPVSEPPLTTAAHSAPATPPTFNGVSKAQALLQPAPGGPWPMAPLGANPMLVANAYRVPSYPSYAGSNGTQPPMRPLS